MLLDEFCVKVYFWPFLSYLASIKGWCPLYPTGYFPVYYTLPAPLPTPPLTPILTSTSAVPPTYQPTPPTTPFPTPPLPTIPFPTPPFPTTVTTTTEVIVTLPPPTLPPPTLPPPTLPPATCPPSPFVCLPGGVPPLPNCPCIDPRQQQPQQQNQPPSSLPNGSDMMVFVQLNPTGRRRRPQQQSCQDARSRAGSCVPLTSCLHLVETFQAGTVSNELQLFLGQSICGFDGSSFLVCCSAEPASIVARRPKEYLPTGVGFSFSSLGAPTTQNPPPIVVFQPTPPHNQGQFVVHTTTPRVVPPTFPSNLPSSSACGVGGATTNRVVGGMPVRKGAYPWMAALGYIDDTNPNAIKFLCAGSLISSTFVVTSAHCINPTLTLVRLGAHDLSQLNEAGAVNFRIRRSIVHDQYDLSSIANDIGMIELNGEAPSGGDIRPICLPDSSRFQREDQLVGMNPFVAGFGATQHQGSTSNVLRDAQVPIVSRQSCEQNYKSVFQFVQFSDKLICAGSSRVDACQGDSGGPLMLPQLDGNMYRYYLLGIVSFGYECARPGFPGVYTRTSSYLDWIQQILRGYSRGRKRRSISQNLGLRN
ncbi:GH15922 [Drosophila grimshawi]|uniref:Acrosin n=1 Tax=Drosophila grimshawi TaxID=7222 RepID=B4J1E4_DROGR|nr:GH15922 [Drosophila grimshawi]